MYNDTMLIQVADKKAMELLYELEVLHLIKVLKINNINIKTKLSDKYKGIISQEQGQNLKEHIKQIRDEWNTI